MRILVAVAPVDFRRGIDGLAAIGRQQLQQAPMNGWAFVFRNRRATAVKSRNNPIGAVEIGHRTASLCHLGNIVMLLKRKLQWNPRAERFVNDAEANQMLNRPMRTPWQL
ncbi:MAG: transposase [Rhodopirellula sp.]|nr:transposase [Rhodopirellula sp.]